MATHSYFILAEALTNAVRHARRRRARWSAWPSATTGCTSRSPTTGSAGARPTGAGLRGIADRVEALDGRADASHSPVGGGTRVEVVLPCAS